MDKNNEIKNNNYSSIISSLRSPMSMFGLAMLICNAVFSTSAAIMNNLDAFIYSIHTFLAIVFLFVIIAIWSPRTLYHPTDLKDLDKEVPEIKNSRLIITFVILLAGFSYAGYQLYKLNKVTDSWCVPEFSIARTDGDYTYTWTIFTSNQYGKNQCRQTFLINSTGSITI